MGDLNGFERIWMDLRIWRSFCDTSDIQINGTSGYDPLRIGPETSWLRSLMGQPGHTVSVMYPENTAKPKPKMTGMSLMDIGYVLVAHSYPEDGWLNMVEYGWHLWVKELAIWIWHLDGHTLTFWTWDQNVLKRLTARVTSSMNHYRSHCSHVQRMNVQSGARSNSATNGR